MNLNLKNAFEEASVDKVLSLLHLNAGIINGYAATVFEHPQHIAGHCVLAAVFLVAAYKDYTRDSSLFMPLDDECHDDGFVEITNPHECAVEARNFKNRHSPVEEVRARYDAFMAQDRSAIDERLIVLENPKRIPQPTVRWRRCDF